MTYSISPDRKTLMILVTEEERQELRELPDEGPASIHSEDAMFDFLEPLVCNSELQWIPEGVTGDLTSAPMLGILAEPRPFSKGDETIAHIVTGSNEISEVLERWAFMDYQVRSVLEDLRDTGKAIFTNGE